MNEWKKVKLRELITIRNGKDHKLLHDGIYPVYGSGGIMRYVDRFLYDKESVLLPRKGTLNNIQYAKSPFWTVDTCYYTVVDTEKVNPYFLYRYLGLFDIESLNTGSAVPSMTFDKYYSLDIHLPSIDTQQRIATILSSYDSLIENYQKQIKLLEESAQRLYKEWFIDLCFPGHENTKIVDGVPEGWEKKKVGALISKVRRTKQVSANNYLNSGCIPVIDQSRNYIAGYTNDIESLVKVTIPYIVFGDHTRVLKYVPFSFAKGADGTQLIMSNDLERMPQSLFYNSLIEIDLSNYSYARHFKYLKEESILVPPKDIAQRYDKVVSQYCQSIQKCRDQIRHLTEARDRLLPKLMNGEIGV